MKNGNDGFTCECGKFHKYPAYVIAHWDIELVHKCDCGRKHIILCGDATLKEEAHANPA